MTFDEKSQADCLSVVDNLVDMPPVTADSKMAQRFLHDMTLSAGGTPNMLRDKARDIWKLAIDNHAKSIFKLGLIDSFMPVYLLADKNKGLCITEGCNVTVAYNSPGFVNYSVAPSSFEKLIPLPIGASSFVALDMGPLDRLVAIDQSGEPPAPEPLRNFFTASSSERFLVLSGEKSSVIEIQSFVSTPACSPIASGHETECNAFKKMYDEVFPGRPSSDYSVIENTSGIPTYNVWYPNVDKVIIRKMFCEKK